MRLLHQPPMSGERVFDIRLRHATMSRHGHRDQKGWAAKVIFRGLFVGIDRYQDGRVPWLAGAARDSAALHALFTDSLGDASGLSPDRRLSFSSRSTSDNVAA